MGTRLGSYQHQLQLYHISTRCSLFSSCALYSPVVHFYVVAEEASNFLQTTLWSRYYRCSLFTTCAYVVVEEASNFLQHTLWFRQYRRLWLFSACAYKLRLQETMCLTDNVRLTSSIIVATPSMGNHVIAKSVIVNVEQTSVRRLYLFFFTKV